MKPIDHATLAGSAVPLDAPLVVHVVRQFLPNRGGLEDVVYNLARQSLLSGYRVRVVTLNSLFSDCRRLLPERETIDGLDIVRIPWRGSTRYPIAPSVLNHIADADLVHVHAIDFFFDFLALTRPLHRRTLVATTHGGYFHTRRFAAIKKLWFQTLTRFSASRYEALIGCSESDVDTFRKIAPRRTRLIENGTDIDKFSDAASATVAKRIVTLGRFSVNKRLDRLIAAFAVLVARDPAWRLDILGVPSDLSATDLAAMIAERDLAPAISVHTNLDNQSIRRIMASSSFFASASEYEGFGLVAIEAMSAGLLPVLQDNAAYARLAARHPTITTTDFAQSDLAASDIERCHAQYAEEPSTIRLRLEAAAATYDWSRVAERYFALYESCLCPQSGGSGETAIETGSVAETRSQVR